MELLLLLIIPLMIAVLVLGFKGLSKEKQIYQRYRNVFGKWGARFCVTFFFLFVFCTAGTLLALIMGEVESGLASIGQLLLIFATGIVGLVISVCIYRNAKAKCPKKLRKDLLKNMILAAFGSSMRTVFAFLPIFGGFLDNTVVTTGLDTSVTRGSELVDCYTNDVYRVSDIRSGVAYIERDGVSVAVNGTGDSFTDSSGNRYRLR